MPRKIRLKIAAGYRRPLPTQADEPHLWHIYISKIFRMDHHILGNEAFTAQQSASASLFESPFLPLRRPRKVIWSETLAMFSSFI